MCRKVFLNLWNMDRYIVGRMEGYQLTCFDKIPGNCGELQQFSNSNFH